MTGVLQMLLAGFGGAATDEYFEYVTMLLPGNGTNGAQNNTFLDSSTNNFTITRNGNTTQGTFTPYGSNWSNYFGGSGDFIYVADSSAFTLGSGDFTVEAWVWTGVTATQKVISGQINGAGDVTSLSYQLDISSSDFPRIIVASGSTTYIATSSTTLPKNQWVHVAGVRDGSTLRIYVNGVQYGTQSVTGVTVNDSSANVSVGRHGQYAGLDWNGYISNFRLVKGTCVYPSGTTFTPSTSPLTAITNTSLLTCQSNRFIDNSTNNFTITRNGDVSVQRFSPFNPTTPYAAGTIGGSGYFDGSGDTLTAANNSAFNPGTGDFTIECWINTSATVAYQTIASVYGAPGSYNGWYFGLNSAGTKAVMSLFNGSSAQTDYTSTTTVNNGAWCHIAFVRTGTTVGLFINGTREATGTNSYNITATSGLQISGYPATSRDWNGYISNFRIIKGSGPYDATQSTLTIPTAPLTAITNTSLLLNFTNGGIIDNAMMNDLETVGNAQISTSVSKFGGGSLAFDGTGDWLTMPNSKGLYIGSGDFTIEGWLYLNALGSVRAIVSQFSSGGTGPGWTLYTKTTNVLEFYGGSGTVTVTGTTAIAATTWTHFAVVRSGSTITIYVNGVAGGSATNSSFSDDTTALGYVGGRADSSGLALNGYIDDLRITKYARYTANFTPPTQAFPTQ